MKKVFIIDDDPLFLEIIRFEMERIYDFEISTFTGAIDALNKMHEQPDLVMLDFFLDSENSDGISGNKALGIFQSDYPDTALMLMSSNFNEDVLMEFKKYRKVDFVTKNEIGTMAFEERIKEKIFVQ